MDLIGTFVDRYQVEAQLGQGSYGAVYRARHTVLDTAVALKVLWPDKADDPKNVERFLREARAAASIGSERIVRVIDAGTTPDGVVFLALELLDGQDLSDVLEQRGRLSVDETLSTMLQVLEGLTAAHAKGIVHRDLKPANVFVTRASGIKILDFGISKILGAESLTERGTALGTPRYMAPEQLSGSRVDARADLYAVGVMLYQMLCGAPPYEGSGYELIVRRVKGEAPVPLGSRASISPVLEEVVHRALSNDPAGRWASAGSLRRALEAAQRGERVHEAADAVTMNPSVSPLSGPVRAQSTSATEPTAKVREHAGAVPTAPMPRSQPSVRPAPSQPSLASAPTERALRITKDEAPRSAPALQSATTMLVSSVRGPAWGWAAIAGLAVLFSLATGIFGVLAWRVGSRKDSPRRSAPSAPAVSSPESPLTTVPDDRRPSAPDVDAPSAVNDVPDDRQPALEAAQPPASSSAPAPSLVEFEIQRVGRGGRRAYLQAYLDERRPAFAECAVERPAEIPLFVSVSVTAANASEHPSYSSTAPSATQCVIDAVQSGEPPRDDASGVVFVRLPARVP